MTKEEAERVVGLKPAIKDLFLMRDEKPLCKIPCEDSGLLEYVVAVMLGAHQTNSMHCCLPYMEDVELDTQAAPFSEHSFHIALDFLVENARLKRLFFRALMGRNADREMTAQIRYQIFQQTDEYGRRACSYDEYRSLFKEFAYGEYCRCQDFHEYYGWLIRSERLVNGDQVAANFLETTEKRIKAFPLESDEELLETLVHGLDIHPHHRMPFAALIAKHRQKAA